LDVGLGLAMTAAIVIRRSASHNPRPAVTANLVLAIFALLPLLAGAALVRFFQRRSGAGRPPASELVAGNALVLLWLLSLALLGGELYYRFVYDTTDAFGLARVTGEWMRVHVRANQFGFRDSVEYGFDPPPGQVRVTFLGDSFTAGHGVADVERRFANRIRRARRDWDVHVMATNGFDTGAEHDLLGRLVGARYPFGVVVLVYCLNDIADLLPEWQALQARLYQRPRPPFLVDHSYLLNTLWFRGVGARNPGTAGYYHFVLDAYRGPPWQAQRERLAAMAERVRDGGGELVVVVFPFLHRLGPGYEYAGVHEQLGRAFDELGVAHLDLLPVFGEQAPARLVVNARDPHPNELAHELVAQALLPFLDPLVQARGQ
jgi:lysophospholipase L1-like esterase